MQELTTLLNHFDKFEQKLINNEFSQQFILQLANEGLEIYQSCLQERQFSQYIQQQELITLYNSQISEVNYLLLLYIDQQLKEYQEQKLQKNQLHLSLSFKKKKQIEYIPLVTPRFSHKGNDISLDDELEQQFKELLAQEKKIQKIEEQLNQDEAIIKQSINFQENDIKKFKQKIEKMQKEKQKFNDQKQQQKKNLNLHQEKQTKLQQIIQEEAKSLNDIVYLMKQQQSTNDSKTEELINRNEELRLLEEKKILKQKQEFNELVNMNEQFECVHLAKYYGDQVGNKYPNISMCNLSKDEKTNFDFRKSRVLLENKENIPLISNTQYEIKLKDNQQNKQILDKSLPYNHSILPKHPSNQKLQRNRLSYQRIKKSKPKSLFSMQQILEHRDENKEGAQFQSNGKYNQIANEHSKNLTKIELGTEQSEQSTFVKELNFFVDGLNNDDYLENNSSKEKLSQITENNFSFLDNTNADPDKKQDLSNKSQQKIKQQKKTAKTGKVDKTDNVPVKSSTINFENTEKQAQWFYNPMDYESKLLTDNIKKMKQTRDIKPQQHDDNQISCSVCQIF